MKLYFRANAELCFPLSYHREIMKENEEKEITLYEAKRETGVPYFFCKEFQELGMFK